MLPIITTTRYVILDSTQNTSSNHSANEASLLCCRACLSSDGRVLFDMADNDLINVFSRVVGIPMMNDLLPQFLCVYCRSLLLRCASFKDKCVQIHNRLLHELCNGTLNAEVIRRLNHTSKNILDLSSTGVEIVDCVPSEDIKYEEAPNDIDTETVEYVDEDFLLVEDINNIETIEIDDKTDEQNIEEFVMDSISNRIYGTDLRNQIDKIVTKNEIPLNKKTNSNKKTKGIKKKKTEKIAKLKIGKYVKKDEVQVTDTMATENDDKIHVLNNYTMPMKPKLNFANEESNGGKCNVRNKLVSVNPVKDDNKEKIEERRNKTFETDYSVRILVLSKEEQLAEILARKESRNYQESEYRCEQCFKGFALKTTFENHMLKHNPSVGAFSCEICHTRFASKSRWQSHLAIHRLKIICKECGFVTRKREIAKQHQASHAGKTYDCPHCGKIFVKRTTFLSHVRLAHPAQNVACELCGEMFVGTFGLRVHKTKVHAEKIKCTVCSAKFVNLAALNRHMEAAGEHTDLPCEQCGENCASEDALREHLGVMHPTESHLCRTCDMSFPSALAYEQKHRQLGTKKPDLRRSQPTYKRRVHRVDQESLPSPHMCEQCGKILPNAASLWYHQRVHEGVKPFVCDYCQRAFTTKVMLIWHIRTHTGEKPYKCPECPLTFSAKNNCDRHHKAVHLGVRGCFPCHICGSTVTTKGSLRVHIEAKHGGKGWPRSRKRNKNASTSAENKF